MFEAAVDGFGGAIGGVGVVEVGQDVPGSAFEGSVIGCKQFSCSGDAVGGADHGVSSDAEC